MIPHSSESITDLIDRSSIGTRRVRLLARRFRTRRGSDRSGGGAIVSRSGARFLAVLEAESPRYIVRCD